MEKVQKLRQSRGQVMVEHIGVERGIALRPCNKACEAKVHTEQQSWEDIVLQLGATAYCKGCKLSTCFIIVAA